jgi:signal transduction histidine kinase
VPRESLPADIQASEASSFAELRAQLLRSEKLIALGRLVPSFAHELNNPVGVAITSATTTVGRIDLLLELLAHDEIDATEVQHLANDIRSGLRLCISNLQRASELVASFKRVAIEQVAERRGRFSVLQLIHDTTDSLRPYLKRGGVTLEIRANGDAELYGAPGALSQVVTNLVLNAIEHGYPPGRSFADKRVIVETRADSREGVRIEIRDFGAGIASEYRPRLFTPFETTARDRGGTGLGLSIVREIVTRQFGGTIDCESEPGQGTTFLLQLPLTSPDDKEAA